MAANKRKSETPVHDEEEEVEYVETSEEEEEEEVEEVEEEEEEEVEEEEEDDDNEEEVEEEEDDNEEEGEEESEESKRESIKKLLEPFSKDQILELLKTAALQNDAIINQITQSADKDTTHRKVFVHGLGWDCTNETLLSSFKQYGEIELGNVVTDKTTGKSKGYGFILFKTRKAAAKAIKEPQKKIGNRMTACQLAAAGPLGANQSQSQNHKLPDSSVSARKIYVANVASHLNPEKLREFFEKFGEIEEGPIGFDRATGKLKGYALFVYKTVDGCNKALEQPTKLFEGTQLHCKKAFDKTQIGAGENAMGVGSLPLNYMNPAAAASLAGPQAIGILSPAAAFANSTGYSPSLARGLSPLTSRSDTVGSNLGLGAGYGMQSSINSISPSVIGNYGSQAALQGLGAYQSSQLGQSSAAAQSALGSLGAFPSYLGR